MWGSLAYSRAMLAFTPDGAPGDEDLMLAYAAGDASAFDALYERHRGGVYRYLVRHCGNAAACARLPPILITHMGKLRTRKNLQHRGGFGETFGILRV